MTRFPAIPPEDRSPEQQKLAAALVKSPRGAVRGPYVPLIYSPELADRMRHLGDFIRFEGVLPVRLKEILVLLTARRWSVDYMFAVHRDFSAAAGVDPAIAEAIANGKRPPDLSREESTAYDLAQALLETGHANDAIFAAARAHFDERAIVEIVAFVGYYGMLALILNVAETPLPEGGVPLPPLR